jgi:hypothetical protein
MTATQDYAVLEEVRREWSEHDQQRFAETLVRIVWHRRGVLGSPPVLRYEPWDYTKAAEIVRKEEG